MTVMQRAAEPTLGRHPEGVIHTRRLDRSRRLPLASAWSDTIRRLTLDLGQEETLSGPAEVEFLGKDVECLNLIERHALCCYGLAQIADDSGVAVHVSVPVGDVDRGPIACAYDRAGR